MVIKEQSNVDNVNRDYKAALDSLFHNGKPIYPEGQMEQKTKEINFLYLQDLYNIRRAAEKQRQEANDLEARANQEPASYLTDSELSALETRKAIVAKEAKNMSIDDFLRVAGRSSGRASQLAYYEQIAELEPQNKKQSAALIETREKLRQAILPQELRNAKQEAARLRINAEIERVAVKATLHDLSGQPAGNFNPFVD